MSPGRKPSRSPASTAGPGEDDAVHLLRLQRLHRERDREVALAGARPGRSRTSPCGRAPRRRSASGPRSSAGSLLRPRTTSVVSTSVGRWSAFSISIERPRPSRSSSWPCSSSTTISSNSRPTRSASARVAGDGDLVAAHEDLHRERGLDQAQQLVALTEQTHHEVVARDQDLDLRSATARPTSAHEVVSGAPGVEDAADRPSTEPRRSGRPSGAEAELLEPHAELFEAAAHARRRAPAGRSAGS